MVNIIKEEITLEESLKKKLEFICDFAKVKPTIINGSIRKIDKTNLTNIGPHLMFFYCHLIYECLYVHLLVQKSFFHIHLVMLVMNLFQIYFGCLFC